MSHSSTTSKPDDVGRFAVEVRRPHIDPTWRRLESVGTFPTQKRATEEVFHCQDRNPACEYRVLDLSQTATPAPDHQERHPLPPAQEKASNWRGTIYLVRRGPEDYYKRFAEQYPVPARWVQAVVDQAGTSDADWKVLQAAGSLLADLENWALRAAHAIRARRATRFDTLVTELAELLNLGPSGIAPESPASPEDTFGSEAEATAREVMPSPDSASRKTGASECGTESPASTTARAGHGASTREGGAESGSAHTPSAAIAKAGGAA